MVAPHVCIYVTPGLLEQTDALSQQYNTQDRQCTYNVTMRHVHVTIVATEEH